MSRYAAPAQGAEDHWEDVQRRCLNCNGIIPGLQDQDLGIGLDTKLGLVSDECALICNACTAQLVETRPVVAKSVTRRR